MKMLLCLVLVAAPLSFAQEKLGSISGKVIYADGSPVAAVQVGYLREAPLNLAAPPAAPTWSDSSGAFRLSGLAAGTYTICVQGTSADGPVDPCLWSDAPVHVSLIPGQDKSEIRIEVQKAAILEFQVSDPVGALAASESKKSASFFAVGVSTGKHIFVPAIGAGSGVKSRSYQVRVPQGVAFRVGLQSNGFRVLSDTGVAVAAGTVNDHFTVAPGTTKSVITLTVGEALP